MATPTSRRAFLRTLAGTAAGFSALDGATALEASPRRPLRGRSVDEPFWEAVKARFPLRDDILPMNAANLAPAPSAVMEAVITTMRNLEGDVSAQNRAKFSGIQTAARERMATLLGADPGEIALVRNASEANNIVVGGLPLGPGDEVLLFDQNHQTNSDSWAVRADRYGYTVREIGVEGQPGSSQGLVELFVGAIRPATRVISFSDLSNTTGLQLPTREICHAARERGIYVHVDGAQTLGAVQRDLHDLGCDSYAASAHKWLMGPKEVGVPYVRADRVDDLWPGVVGVGYGSGPEPNADGAGKFETLGQRNDATIAGLLPILDLYDEIGSAVIAARIVELASLLKEGIGGIPGAQLVTPVAPALSGGVVISSYPGKNNRDIYQTLYNEHSIAGASTGGVRLCPHVYTTRADIERTVDALERVVAAA
ncbi:MAG: aminotransferase class V-fold PLP-dependent enzyme [Gemmatimonadota bacterium]